MLCAAVGTLVIASTATATAPKLPSAGTASQIARLVAASVNIKTLSPTVLNKVGNAFNDNAAVDYPKTKNGCPALRTCDFGDTKSSKKIVIMGDSHAQMWIPALNRIGNALKLKVIVLYMAQCPAASLDVWLSIYNKSYTACSQQRTAWIATLNKIHPLTVLLTDHTNGVHSAASSGTQPFTSAEWQAGLQTTIAELKPSKAKLAVIGDPVTFDTEPPICLANNQSEVQKCDALTPNPDRPGQQVAERAAANAAKVLYVDPTKWLCTATTCSPVVGNYIVFYDSFHISCTYAAFLSGVLQASLKKVL